VGMILCAAGIVGIWIVRPPLRERLTRVFDRVDGLLDTARRDLVVVQVAVNRSRQELAAFRQAPREGAAASKRQGLRKNLSRTVARELAPRSGDLRATLGRVAEASVALNGLLAGADKLPFAAPAGLDAESMGDVHETLTQVTKRAQELSSLFPEDGTGSPDEKAGPPRAEKALDALQELTEECE